MTNDPAVTEGGRTPNYKRRMLQTVAELYGEEHRDVLSYEWKQTGITWFGAFLRERHFDVYLRVVAFLKINGEW